MRAFQLLWTPVAYHRTWGGLERSRPPESVGDLFPDYYLLTILLSALEWRRHHGGPLTLYGDETSVRFFRHYGLLRLWDTYDEELPHEVDARIDRGCFWSAGKAYALLREPAPCVQLDVDLVLHQPLNVEGITVGFTHWEDTSASDYYPPPQRLRTARGYTFRPEWDWSLPAANTALMYFGDDRVKHRYADEVLRFAVGNQMTGLSHLIQPELLFADQRLLPMSAHASGFGSRTRPFLDAVWDPACGRFVKHDSRWGEWRFWDLYALGPFTHLWIYKQYLEKNAHARAEYCRRALDAVVALAPVLYDVLRRIACLRPYFTAADLTKAS